MANSEQSGILVIGGSGILGAAIIRQFSGWKLTASVDFQSNDEAATNVILDSRGDSKAHVN
jgi:hypothetical protein